MARSTTEATTPTTWSFRNRRTGGIGRPAAPPTERIDNGDTHDRSEQRSQPTPRHERYEGSGIALGVVMLLLASACMVVVVAQNTRSVRFEFLWWDTNISLAALLLATGLIVAVVEELVGLAWRRRRRTMRTLASGS
jgi:uncharacterized integral membrane protein